MKEMKKGQRFFSKAYHRYVYFERTRFSRLHGCTVYMFRDICDASIEIEERYIETDLEG